MTLPLLALPLAFFSFASGISLLLAFQGRASGVGLSHPLRLRSPSLNASDEACRSGHEAAWILLLVEGLVMDFHLIGLVLAIFVMGPEGGSYAAVIAVTGVVMAIALTLVARAAASRAASREVRGPIE